MDRAQRVHEKNKVIHLVVFTPRVKVAKMLQIAHSYVLHAR